MVFIISESLWAVLNKVCPKPYKNQTGFLRISNGQKKNIDRVQMRLLFYSFHKNRGSLLANITEMVDL
jgi:hypothetical protein